MCSTVPSLFLYPSKLNHVWAFQGKSLPAVKSMSASLTVQTVEPERKRRTFARRALDVACRLVSSEAACLCTGSVPPGRRERVPACRDATLLEGGRALALMRVRVVKPAP